jgi:hypothetical protein
VGQRLKLTEISKINNQNILLDTNVWLFVDSPYSRRDQSIIDKYTKAVSDILKYKNKIILDHIIISEFSNRFIRAAFEIYKNRNNLTQDFDFKKDYKLTLDYTSTIKIICNRIKGYLTFTNTGNLLAEKADFLKIIDSYQNFFIDYNDAYTIQLCSKHNYFLLTDDADFKEADINIISGNQKYFK